MLHPASDSLDRSELEAQRNLFAAKELYAFRGLEIDVDGAYARFKAKRDADQPLVSPHPARRTVWLATLVTGIAAVLVLGFLLVRQQPQMETLAMKQTVKRHWVKGQVYEAGERNASVQLADEDGNIVSSQATQNGTLDALQLATRSKSLTVTIPKGKSYVVKLSDGSRVELFADSRLTFPSSFVGKNRVVELEGQAYFKVRHLDDSPFIVKTQHMTTTVLGTEFVVKADEGAAPEVTLLSGRVAVTSVKAKNFLMPGQCASIRNDGSQNVRNVSIDKYVWWRDGYYYYDDESLLDVMVDLGRNYNVNVIFSSPTLKNKKIHFVAERNSNIDNIVWMLNQMGGIHVEKRGESLIVK